MELIQLIFPPVVFLFLEPVELKYLSMHQLCKQEPSFKAGGHTRDQSWGGFSVVFFLSRLTGKWISTN